MKNILTLFRAEAYSSLNPRRLLERRSKKKGSAGALVFGVFILALMLFSSGVYAFLIGKSVSDAGTPEALLLLFFAADALLTLITSAATGSARMFRATNMDSLMSMPFTGFQIYVGKLLAFLAENYLYSAIIMLPAFVAYAYFAAPPLIFAIAAIALFLTVPMLPVGLGLLISAAVSRISFGGKSKMLRNIIGVALFIAAYLWFVSRSDGIMLYLIMNASDLTAAAGKYFPPLKWCMEGALLNWGSLLLFAAVSVAFILLVAFIASLRFNRSVGRANAAPKAKGGAVKAEAARSVFSALFRKEAACYFSSFAYFMNTAFGPILLCIAAVYFSLFRSGPEIALAGMTGMVAPIAMLVMAFACIMCCTTASSISIEGTRLAQLKAMPLRPRDVFGAKIALNMLVCGVPVFIASVCVTASGLVSLGEGALVLAGGLFCAAFISVSGLLINLSHPKLEWTNENSVVKQSAAVGLTTGLGFAFSAVCGVVFYLLFFKLQAGGTLTLAALAALALVAAVCVSLLLKAKGEKLYNAL